MYLFLDELVSTQPPLVSHTDSGKKLFLELLSHFPDSVTVPTAVGRSFYTATKCSHVTIAKCPYRSNNHRQIHSLLVATDIVIWVHFLILSKGGFMHLCPSLLHLFLLAKMTREVQMLRTDWKAKVQSEGRKRWRSEGKASDSDTDFAQVVEVQSVIEKRNAEECFPHHEIAASFVNNFVVVINKMDEVQWNRQFYEEAVEYCTNLLAKVNLFFEEKVLPARVKKNCFLIWWHEFWWLFRLKGTKKTCSLCLLVALS